VPKVFTTTLPHRDKMVKVTVYFAEGESDPSLNSNVYDIVQKLMLEHFPGHFDAKPIELQLTAMIFKQLEKAQAAETHHTPAAPAAAAAAAPAAGGAASGPAAHEDSFSYREQISVMTKGSRHMSKFESQINPRSKTEELLGQRVRDNAAATAASSKVEKRKRNFLKKNKTENARVAQCGLHHFLLLLLLKIKLCRPSAWMRRLSRHRATVR
jgi:hypothetical protein